MRFLVFAASLLVASSAAFAGDAPPRTIDMTTPILDMHGKPIPDSTQAPADDRQCAKNDCPNLTLGAVVTWALTIDRAPEPGQQPLSSVSKAKQFALALRVQDQKAVALNATDLSTITKLLNVWPPVIVGRALSLLDPAAMKEEP